MPLGRWVVVSFRQSVLNSTIFVPPVVGHMESVR